MLIRCALYVSGVQPATSETVWVPAESARMFEMNDAGGRRYVNVVQTDDGAGGLPAAYGIVPPGPAHPGWAATPNGIMACAGWWDSVLRAIGTTG